MMNYCRLEACVLFVVGWGLTLLRSVYAVISRWLLGAPTLQPFQLHFMSEGHCNLSSLIISSNCDKFSASYKHKIANTDRISERRTGS
jgi:hypothetical protein